MPKSDKPSPSEVVYEQRQRQDEKQDHHRKRDKADED
jgi:hypothetical protein